MTVRANQPLSQFRDRLGAFGVWTTHLNRQPIDEACRTARHLEEAGFGSLWYGEGLDTRDCFVNAALLLAATREIAVGAGVANVYARDAGATNTAAHTLAEAFPGRFILGIGVSHEATVEARGHVYQPPLSKMKRYLGEMERQTYMRAPLGASELDDDPRGQAFETPPTLVAALGPKMTALGGEAGDGVHPFLVTAEHTKAARELLGPRPLLIPEQGFVLAEDESEARRIAREHVAWYLEAPNYRQSLQRLGYEPTDLADGGSDRIIDALVAWGDPTTVAMKVRKHLLAGADHVVLQPLRDDAGKAMADLIALAPALSDGSGREGSGGT